MSADRKRSGRGKPGRRVVRQRKRPATPPPPAEDYTAWPESVLLQRTGSVIVADKPAGLASTGRTLDDPDCLQALIMARLGRRKVWAVHQLDRGTTGLNLFVLRKSLVSQWQERLHPPNGRKLYLAVIHGAWEGDERTIDAPIGRATLEDGRSRAAIAEDGKPARTLIRPHGVAGDFSLVEAEPLTGRTHQVRLHLASIGHPVVGERDHRDPPCERHPWPALHAWRLELDDGPQELRSLRAPLPAALEALLGELGLEPPA